MAAGGGFRPNGDFGRQVARNGGKDFMDELGRRSRTAARKHAPKRTGALRASTDYTTRVGGVGVSMVLKSDEAYSVPINLGRGGFAKKPNGPMLRFKPVGSSKFIYRASVGPAPAYDYLIKGLEEAARSMGLRGKVRRTRPLNPRRKR